jgi:hypothetical protein
VRHTRTFTYNPTCALMPTVMTNQVVRASWVAILLAACGGAAVPQEQLTAAQAASKGAEVAGAAEDPKAALYLKLSKEEIEKAKALIADGDNEEAARLIDRAQADADLSFVLAKEARTKKEVAEAREQVEQVKKRMGP